MNVLIRSLIWVRRFRHRCGYGVHSPFAFNLITGVIYEKGEFYAYSPLRELRGEAKGREKDDKLMLRLINDRQPDTCLAILPEGEATSRYLKAGCRKCKIAKAATWSAEAEATLQKWGKADMIYIDHPRWAEMVERALPHTDEHTLIVLKGIHRNAASRRAWQQLLDREEVRVTFDLHHFGLIYRLQRLNRQHYLVNYF